MTTHDLYIQLKEIDLFKDKIYLLEKGNSENIFFEECIKLYFSEHLTVLISVDVIHQECYVDFNRLTHCHFDIDNIIEGLTYLANGDLIFIEKKRFFTKNHYIDGIVERKPFEERKEKIINGRVVKIYSAVELIYQSK